MFTKRSSMVTLDPDMEKVNRSMSSESWQNLIDFTIVDKLRRALKYITSDKASI